jgi:hypothetical protein
MARAPKPKNQGGAGTPKVQSPRESTRKGGSKAKSGGGRGVRNSKPSGTHGTGRGTS